MRKVAAIVLMVAVVCVPSASHATTLEIQTGGIASDEGTRDIFGSFSGAGFSVVGSSPALRLCLGCAGGIGQFAGGFFSFGVGDFAAVITVNGAGSCNPVPFTGCGGSLSLTSTPFTAPPPSTDFFISGIPFTAVGQLTVQGTEFDLVGHGLLSVRELCEFNCSPQGGFFITIASYTFVAPEPPTLLLGAVGLSLTVAASLTRRRHRRH